MSRTPRLCVALIGLALAVVMVSGCQPAGGPNGGQNGSAPTVAAKTLPAGLPSDLPVYAGTVVASAKATSGGKTTFSFTIETADDPKTVAEWYRTHLDKAGWTVTSNGAGGPVAMMSASKGSSQASVASGKSGGKTAVVCVLVVKS